MLPAHTQCTRARLHTAPKKPSPTAPTPLEPVHFQQRGPGAPKAGRVDAVRCVRRVGRGRIRSSAMADLLPWRMWLATLPHNRPTHRTRQPPRRPSIPANGNIKAPPCEPRRSAFPPPMGAALARETRLSPQARAPWWPPSPWTSGRGWTSCCFQTSGPRPVVASSDGLGLARAAWLTAARPCVVGRESRRPLPSFLHSMCRTDGTAALAPCPPPPPTHPIRAMTYRDTYVQAGNTVGAATFGAQCNWSRSAVHLGLTPAAAAHGLCLGEAFAFEADNPPSCDPPPRRQRRPKQRPHARSTNRPQKVFPPVPAGASSTVLVQAEAVAAAVGSPLHVPPITAFLRGPRDLLVGPFSRGQC